MKRRPWRFLLLLALLVGVVGSPFASRSPDGLERVALDYGFSGQEAKAILPAPLPDYRLPMVASEQVATALAGLIGVGIVFAAVAGVACLLVKRESPSPLGR